MKELNLLKDLKLLLKRQVKYKITAVKIVLRRIPKERKIISISQFRISQKVIKINLEVVKAITTCQSSHNPQLFKINREINLTTLPLLHPSNNTLNNLCYSLILTWEKSNLKGLLCLKEIQQKNLPLSFVKNTVNIDNVNFLFRSG